jgi:hypothetical protein
MDPAYLNWIGIMLAGAVLGLFIRPRYLAMLAGALEVVAIAGLLACGEFLHSDRAMLFGMAAMVVPVVGALAAFGALLGAAIRRTLNRRIRDREQ